MLKYINALRLPLAALVVFIHSYNTAWRGINSQVVDGLGTILSRTLPTFAVPLFFAISGYLFFINQQTFSWKGYVEKLHRRFYTLLIPYICWNVIAFALYALKDVSAGQLLHLPLSFNLFWGCTQVGGEGANILGWHVMASTAPVQEPLWFVRDLMVIVLCSPFLYAILRYLKWLGLAIVAIVYYAGLWPNVGGMTLIGVWFFMLGAWCGMNKYDVGGKLARYWPICLVSFIISFGLLLGRGAESFVWHHVYVFSAIVTSIAIAYIVSERWPRKYKLSKASFFIYAAHNIVLLPLTTVLAKWATYQSAFVQSIAFMVCPFIAIAVCVIAYLLLQRFFPRTAWIVTGGKRG